MSRHPAPEELLLDYATGSLAHGPALAVALHVALDPMARRMVERLGALGGALIEGEARFTQEGADLDEAALQRTLARLDGLAVEPRRGCGIVRAEERPLHEGPQDAVARHERRVDRRGRHLRGLRDGRDGHGLDRARGVEPTRGGEHPLARLLCRGVSLGGDVASFCGTLRPS